MDSQRIRESISWLKKKVSLIDDDQNLIKFDEPISEDFSAAGFDNEVIEIALKASWWNEMATDIIETPDFAEPDASPEKILSYARDVDKECISKRRLA